MSTTLRMVHGDSAEWDALIRHPITKKPIDIQGVEMRFAAKHSFDDADEDAIFDVSVTDGGITVLEPTSDGRAHIKVPAASTASLPNVLTKLLFDLQVSKNQDRWTTDRGVLIVDPEVVSS